MRFRNILVLVLVAAVIAAGFAGERLLRGDGTTLTARFDSAVGLYPGSDVQILGVPVGKVTAVTPDGDGIEVAMELDPGVRASADTGAVIIAPTLVSDRFVQLTVPYSEGASAIEDGTEITATAVPVEIDEMYASLTDIGKQLGPEGVNKDGALSRFLEVMAANLDGQGADINQMIDDFGDASGTLADVDDDFFATVANLDRLNDELLAHDDEVASANRQLADVASYLSEDREDLAAAITNLGSALGVLDGFIKDNRAALRSSVQNLHGPTQTLVKRRESLAEAVRTIPLALQNFVNAYDVDSNTVSGRGNLNEITLWSESGQTGRTSPDAPPLLLPGMGEE
ncbi:MCE family protein [Nocardioides sp. BGMRC 2183]|nr:MCE family protein [Nocardioides sp. BGMRC 2183]